MLVADPGEDRGPPGVEVRDPWCEAAGVEAQPDEVDRGLQQVGGHALEQGVRRVVGRHQVPAAVDHERGVGLVARQDELERMVHLVQAGRPERQLRGVRHEPGGGEEAATFPQGHGQRLAEPGDHGRARARPPGLDGGQVPGGHAAPVRERLLGQSPPEPPVPHERPDGGSSIRSDVAGDRVEAHERHSVTPAAPGGAARRRKRRRPRPGRRSRPRPERRARPRRRSRGSRRPTRR